ncbi:Uncharacterised protein [Mycobacteroides abscessus subsp. abscessus]|nr:Uncharacterised protein [Mycobacteroides abscessus subsp. abscessus]
MFLHGQLAITQRDVEGLASRVTIGILGASLGWRSRRHGRNRRAALIVAVRTQA